jgi:hypothetical protein
VTTQAISSYGIQLRLGDGVAPAALTITAATNATPIVITTSAAHNIADVAKGTITGVVGNTGANGTFVVSRVSATELTLRGSVGNGTYSSGGSLALDSTYATVAEVTNLEDVGATANLVDVSAHDGNGWASRIPTNMAVNLLRISLNHVPANPTHNPTTGLLMLLHTRTRRPFLVVLPDAAKTAWWFSGYVTRWQDAAPANGALTAAVELELPDAPILSAA